MESKKVNQGCITRRDFLRASGGVASGIACSTMLPTGLAHACTGTCDEMPVLSGYQPMVSSAWVPKGEHEESYDLFKQMVEAATDFSWLSPGDRIFLKLSINSGVPFPATTDPWALACMIQLLKEKGAGEIVAGDQSGAEYVVWTEDYQRGSSRDLCESSGLLDIILDTNVTPCFFEERGYDAYTETYPSGSHHWDRPVYVTTALDEIDHIVYMPRVAHHIMGDVSTGMKVAVGFLRDDSRVAFHQGGDNFYTMYEEINHVPEIDSKLRLVVTSGRSVMSTIGPDIGHISKPDYGLIFASEDLLANELLAYSWLQWNYEFETSFFAKLAGEITTTRSLVNKAFVKLCFIGVEGQSLITPSIPLFQPGDIYCHPAIINFMERKGGKPEELIWEQINQNPDTSVADYMKSLMKI